MSTFPYGAALFGQPPTPFVPLPGCDVQNSLNDLYFRLGFLNVGDMARDDRWVTLAELYQFADDAVKNLARTSSLFLNYDASINVAIAGATYPLPAGWVWTESAWLVYADQPVVLLRLSTVGQLFALDAQWSATTGNPSRLSLDAAGVGNGVLYPVPIAVAVLNEILGVCPGAVTGVSSALPLSPVLQDYFTDACLAGARGKASDSQMPEVAAHMAERLKLYASVVDSLFGAR